MSDVLFGLWLDSFVRGDCPDMRRTICRAMLLVGTANRHFQPSDGPLVRVGHRRWSLE